MKVDLPDIDQTIANQLIDRVNVELQFIRTFQPTLGQLFVDHRHVQSHFDQQLQDAHVNVLEAFEILSILTLTLNGVVLEEIVDEQIQDVAQRCLRSGARDLLLEIRAENVDILLKALQGVDQRLIVLHLNGLFQFAAESLPDRRATFLQRAGLSLLVVAGLEAGNEMNEVFVDRQLMRGQRPVTEPNGLQKSI